MRTVLLAFLSVTLLLIACKDNRYAQKDVVAVRNDQHQATFPYEDINGLIVIESRINQSGPLKFILDTGAPKTFIFLSERSEGYDQSLSDSLELAWHTEPMNGRSIRFADGLQLTIGNITLKNLSVGAWPSKMFFGRSSYEDVPYDGIIGYDLLQFVTLEINRKNQTITLHDPGSYTLPNGWSYSDIELKDKKPYCRVNVRVKPEDAPLALNLHLDLGNMGPIWLKTDDQKGIRAPAGKEQVVGQWLNGNPQNGVMWPVHELEVFGHRLSGIPTKFIPSGHPHDPSRKGHIGSRELQYFDLAIDYTNKRVAARPVQEYFSLNTETLGFYAGEFRSDDLPLKIILEEKSGLLYFQATGQNALPLIASNLVEFKFEPADISITFLKTVDGEVDYTSFTLVQNGKEYEYVKN